MGEFVIGTVEFNGPPWSITLHGGSIGMASAVTVPVIETTIEGTLGNTLKRLGDMSGLSTFVHPDLAKELLPALTTITTPLHSIDQLARSYGAIAKITEGALSFVPRDTGVSVSGFVAPILQLGPSHLAQWSVRYCDRADYASVQAPWFDREAVTRKCVNQGRLGRSLPIAEDRTFAIGTVYAPEAEAKAAALAMMKSLIQAGGMLYATLTEGDPWIRDQQRLSIAGMREGINGSFTIEKAIHSFSPAGLLTEIQGVSTESGEDFAEGASDDFIIPEPGELMGQRLIDRGTGRIVGPV